MFSPELSYMTPRERDHALSAYFNNVSAKIRAPLARAKHQAFCSGRTSNRRPCCVEWGCYATDVTTVQSVHIGSLTFQTDRVYSGVLGFHTVKECLIKTRILKWPNVLKAHAKLHCKSRHTTYTVPAVSCTSAKGSYAIMYPPNNMPTCLV